MGVIGVAKAIMLLIFTTQVVFGFIRLAKNDNDSALEFFGNATLVLVVIVFVFALEWMISL